MKAEIEVIGELASAPILEECGFSWPALAIWSVEGNGEGWEAVAKARDAVFVLGDGVTTIPDCAAN